MRTAYDHEDYMHEIFKEYSPEDYIRMCDPEDYTKL
jgi:hypothetical protein